MSTRQAIRVCRGCGGPCRNLYCSVGCSKRGPRNHGWSGGRSTTPQSYVKVATGHGGRLEHLLIAERALGRPLPAGAQVHHVNGDRTDNRPRNLVICQDKAYHSLLHELAKVRQAGGRPFVDKVCSRCRLPLPKASFGPAKCRDRVGLNHRCVPCGRAYHHERKAS